MGACASSPDAGPETAPRGRKTRSALEQELRAQSVGDLQKELRARQIPTRGMVEKEDLVQALVQARCRERKNTKKKASSPAKSSYSRTSANSKPSTKSKPLPIQRKTLGKLTKGASQQTVKKPVSKRKDKIDPSRWKMEEIRYNGSASYVSVGKQETVPGQPISRGKALFQKNPHQFAALTYQSNMLDWPKSQQKYTLIHRHGTEDWKPVGVSPNGAFTAILMKYERCRPFPNDELPQPFRDQYTDHMSYQGRKLHSDTRNNKPLMPGRGMGLLDGPGCKIMGDIDPSDICQGAVGDCWLLSAISALAEFDGAIKRLFRKTPNLNQMPLDKPNMYVVTLYDLTTWKEVDIKVDERLCRQADGSGQLLGAKPSVDMELWCCYLEKALAAHCGGWDKIKGGQCTHGWSLLTGCKHQYHIRQNPQTKKYGCFAKYNPITKQWSRHTNCVHDGNQSVWQVPWPKVGGGGDKELTQEELFMRMCAWDDENYIVGASVGGTSDKVRTDGMVNNHAYSVIEAHNDVAGTVIDLFKVRNPWGKGEIENGEFDDDGPGWDRYPQVKRALKPVVADDGIFYLTKDEFFKHFSTIYLSASNMTEFLED